jgi:hypothetical protein
MSPTLITENWHARDVVVNHLVDNVDNQRIHVRYLQVIIGTNTNVLDFTGPK